MMNAPSLYIAEDGEAVGTLRRFSTHFRLSPAAVLECFRQGGPGQVLLESGSGRDRLLVVGEGGVEALRDCGSPGRTARKDRR